MTDRKAVLILFAKETIPPDRFVELRVWQVPEPVPGSNHFYKYRLAYVVSDLCVLRYDNERGKGDHRHFGKAETPYEFSSVEDLVADFWTDVKIWNRWRSK
jgi:hypothetical protein